MDEKKVGFRLLGSEVLDLTPQLARQFHEMETTLTERELNNRHVQHLLNKAIAGKLIPFHWTRAILNGREIRVNGMHSSKMLCQLNDFPPGLKVHLDTFECDDSVALADLHRQIDDKKSMRTGADLSTINQRCSGAPPEESTLFGKFAIRGIGFYYQYVEQVRKVRKGDDIWDYHHQSEFAPYRAWIADLLTDKNKELRKPQIMAALFITYMKTPAVAENFWDMVSRQGTRFAEDAPETRLSNWLLYDLAKLRIRKPREQYNGCIDAWNYHRAGRPMKEIRYDIRKGFHAVAE